jgi:hypothetical protein
MLMLPEVDKNITEEGRMEEASGMETVEALCLI